MSRKRRELSATGVYHVILRGVNRQIIFVDDMDRRKFVRCMKEYSEETSVKIITYCLMDNHIHLLILADDGPADYIKKIASSYVYYYNHKYDRVGHLFQDRYRSEVVDTERYLLVVFRYILRNPQKAGICPVDRYPWSGWKELESELEMPDVPNDSESICNFDLLCYLAGGRENLRQYVLLDNEDTCMEAFTRYTLTDEEALRQIQRIIGTDSPLILADMSKSRRDPLIAELKELGLSTPQISRLTGLTKGMIQDVRK